MFFTAIHQMMTEGVDLTLVIRKANGQLTVSTLPKSNGLKDEAQNHLVPLTVSGLPQELDAGFLQAVARPIQKAAGLISNMAQFEAQAEKAASESKAAKEAKSKETKEEKEKREKYEKHFKKAEELIAVGNHKDAVTSLGQARLYAKPQDQKKIDGMVAEQTKAMNTGSLFELMEEPAPQPQAQPTAAPARQPQPAPQYPPQPQKPMAAQVPGGQQRPVAAPQQQQTMWPPQQPPQGPAQYYATTATIRGTATRTAAGTATDIRELALAGAGAGAGRTVPALRCRTGRTSLPSGGLRGISRFPAVHVRTPCPTLSKSNSLRLWHSKSQE